MKSALSHQTPAIRRPTWAELRPEVTEELLSGITRRVVDQFHPYAVMLFGSYAWGRPHKESDVDLLVVLDANGRGSDRRVEVANAANVRYLPMDVLTNTPQEIATRLAMHDFFIERILRKGKRLYERARPWELLEGRPTMTLQDEWVEKAEADYHGAVRLNRISKNPLPDLVVFHSQQSVEKYLKAFLIKNGGAPEKTHKLLELLKECEKIDPSLSVLLPELTLLDQFSVDPRHPGFSATVEQATSGIAATRQVRKTIRKALGL